MKIIYSPSSCSKPEQNFKFWKILVTKQLLVAIDFLEKKYIMKVKASQQLFGYQYSSKYLRLCSFDILQNIFCVQKKKKTPIGLEQHED